MEHEGPTKIDGRPKDIQLTEDRQTSVTTSKGVTTSVLYSHNSEDRFNSYHKIIHPDGTEQWTWSWTRRFRNIEEVRDWCRSLRRLYVYETRLGPIHIATDESRIGTRIYFIFRDECVVGSFGSIQSAMERLSEGCAIGCDDIKNISELNIPADIGFWRPVQR